MSGSAPVTSAGRAVPWWQPWAALALFAFLLHFAWEMLQAPAYRAMPDARHWDAVQICLLATVGDVVLTLVAYAVIVAATRRRWWLGTPTAGAIAGFVGAGLVITVVVEWLSVYLWHRWAYAPGTPTLFGVGITPLLQWLLLPPLTLWLARQHLGWTPTQPLHPTGRFP